MKKFKGMTSGECGAKRYVSPPPGIYLVTHKCFNVTYNEGDEGKNKISEKRSTLAYVNAKFCCMYG
jgi:hypothetical protein